MSARYGKNIFMVWCCLLTCCSLLRAQENTAAALQVKGKVMDSYGYPLSGARVTVRPSGVFVFTGAEGDFEVAAVPGNTLVISHQQYLVAERKVNGQRAIAVRMDTRPLPLASNPNVNDTLVYISGLPRANRLSVLYGEKNSQTSLGATSTIYTDQLTTTPSTLYAYALPGRLAGLYTKQYTGFPNFNTGGITSPELLFNIPNKAAVGLTSTSDNTEIGLILRGQNAVTVIDGVQRDVFALDPETIESVSVQKDALSSILLGQKSSRGVLLVTTKKPLQGAPHISLTAQTGVQTPLGLPDPLPAYQYAYLVNEALTNSGQAPVYTKQQIDGYRAGKDPYLYPNVNWQDELLDKTALLNRYGLNISGGSSVARYLVNLNYTNQQGMFKEGGNNAYNTQLDFKRYLINTKVDVDLNKNFNIGLQLFGRIQDGNQPGAGVLKLYGNVLTTPNNAYPIFNPDKSFGGNTTYPTNAYSELANSGYILNNDKELTSTIDVTYKMDNWVRGLWFKGKANVSVLTSSAVFRDKVSPVFRMAINGNDTTYARAGNIRTQNNNFSITSSGQSWFYQASLGYTKQLGQHNFEGLVLFDQLQTTYNFDLPSKFTNVAAKLSYNYAGKYMAEGAITYSGYDRYKPGNRFVTLYAAGLGWNMAEENFIKDNLSWLNTLKWRVNYGQTANANIGYFTWRPSFNDQFVPYGYGVTNIAINGVYEGGLVSLTAHPEKAHKLNAGVDIELLNHRLQLTADYYRDEYYDLMQVRGRSIALIGNSYPFENVGRTRYSGTEFTITWQDHVRDFNYFITANGSFANSKILFMDEIGRKHSWNERTGQPVGASFGYIAEGLIQTQKEAETSPSIAGYTLQPGDIKYRDLNGDGIIDQFDETNLTGSKPLFYYGLTAGIQYKGLSISALFQGVQNRMMFLNSWETEFEFGVLTRAGQLFNHHLGRWTPETAATATYPRLTYGANANNQIGNSSFWMHSGDYLRLKNVEVSYTLPYAWTKKLRLAGVRLFANAQNLYTWAEFDRGDPEVNGQKAESGQVAYPMQRVINTGINIKL